MKIYVFILVLLLCTLRVQAQTFPQQVEAPLAESVVIQQRSQKELDAWEQEKTKLLHQYELLLQRQAELKRQNARLEQQLVALTQKMRQSVEAVHQALELGQEMEPFVRESMEALSAVVHQSLPFNQVERTARIQQLEQELLTDEASLAQQFRQLMQILKSEYDYGHSVDVHQVELEIERETLFMTQVRIGRLALFALSLDRQRCAAYDRVSEHWEWLDPRWRDELSKAVAMGNKQRPVDILCLPFGRLVQP